MGLILSIENTLRPTRAIPGAFAPRRAAAAMRRPRAKVFGSEALSPDEAGHTGSGTRAPALAGARFRARLD